MSIKLIKKILPNCLKRETKRFFYNLSDSFHYKFKKSVFKRKKLKHVIFVCKGNICRSAFAEHYMRMLAEGRDIRIESCGIDVDQGRFSPPEAIKVGQEFGVDLSKHNSKGLKNCDFDSADLIIAMEYIQYIKMVELYPEHADKINLLRDFSSWPGKIFCNIYDPFGLSLGEFRRSFNKVKKAILGMCSYL